MALVAITGGYTQFVGSVRMEGSWTGNNLNDIVFCFFQWGYGSFSNNTSEVQSTEESGSYNRTPTVDKDRTIKFRAKVCIENCVVGASSGEFRTYANPAVFPQGLTPGTPSTISCPVSGTVIPNTNESTGDVTIEYRVQGTSTWIETQPIVEDISGTGVTALNSTLTALAPATAYEARFKIVRNTENNTVNYSSVGTFTTQSVSTTVIAPNMMLATAQMLTPSSVGTTSGGSVSVIAILPNTMEVDAEMLLPAVIVGQEAIVEVFVVMNDVIQREVIFG